MIFHDWLLLISMFLMSLYVVAPSVLRYCYFLYDNSFYSHDMTSDSITGSLIITPNPVPPSHFSCPSLGCPLWDKVKGGL